MLEGGGVKGVGAVRSNGGYLCLRKESKLLKEEVGGSYRMSNMLEEASSASSLQLILNSTKFEQKTVHRINYKLLGVHYRC